MTLEQWLKKADVDPQKHDTNPDALSVQIPDNEKKSELFSELWKLEDYHIAAIRWSVIWLLPN